MSLSELSSPEARVRSGSGTHHPSAGPLMCQRAVGRSGELPSLCQHPALEEMGSSLEQEVSKPLGMAMVPCLAQLGGLPSLLTACRATTSLLLPQQGEVFGIPGVAEGPGTIELGAGRKSWGWWRGGGGWWRALYLHGSQQRDQGGSRRHAALHAGSAGARDAPHSAAAGVSPCAAACSGVKHESGASRATQPCEPQALPVVVLLQRVPLVPELPDGLLALSKLLRQPLLLPTPLTQFCFSLPHPRAGSQECLLHPCQLWGRRAWRCHHQCPLGLRAGTLVAWPYLGRGGLAGAAGSGSPHAEPGSPWSPAALAPAPECRCHSAILQRGGWC